MSSYSVLLPRSIDTTQIQYGTPRQLDSGGRTIYVSYGKEKHSFVFQSPKMKVPFGIRSGEKFGQPDKWNMELSFDGMDTDEKKSEFYNKMVELDDRIVSDIMTHSPSWMKKKYAAEEVVRALYTGIIRQAKDEKYAPNIKLSVPFRDGKFAVKCFDKNRSPIDLKEIIDKDGSGKGMYVQVIAQLSVLWVAGGKIGCTLKVEQLLLASDTPMLPAFAFVDELGAPEDADADADGNADGKTDKAPTIRGDVADSSEDE